MRLIAKITFLSVIPTCLVLVCLETGARLVVAFVNRDPNVLCYGTVELHRFLLEDKREIIKQQGTFFPIVTATYDANGGYLRSGYATFKKREGAVRLIVLGESSVYSVTTSAGEAMPAVLEELLNTRAEIARFEVLNMGQASVNSTYIKEVLQPKAFQFEHTVELFYHLNNDFFAPQVLEFQPELALYKLHAVLARLSVLYATSHQLLGRLSEAQFTDATVDRLHQRYCQNVEDMIRACQSRNIVPIVVKQAIDLSYISTTENRYLLFAKLYQRALASLDDIAQRHSIEVIDPTQKFLKEQAPLRRKELFYDTVHLTAAGNRVLAGIISDQLANLHPDWFIEAGPGPVKNE